MSTIAFGPKGKQILAGDTNYKVRLFDASTMQMLKTMKGHDSTVYASTFCADGKWAATGDAGNSVRLWNLETGQCVRRFESGGRVNDVAVSPDGAFLYSGGTKGVRTHHFETGEQCPQLPGQTGPVHDLNLHPTGSLLACTGADGSVWIWNLDRGEVDKTIRCEQGKPSNVAFHATRPLIAMTTNEGMLALYDRSTGQCLEEVQAHEGAIYDVVFSPTDDVVATGGADKLIKLWKVSAASVSSPIEDLR